MQRKLWSEQFSEEKLAELKELLKDFDSICKRKCGSELQNKLQIAASQCIDPVFLIKYEWEKLLLGAPIVPDEPYILVYSLFNNKLMDELIKQAKKQYNCKIVFSGLQGLFSIYHDKMIVNAGPLEFLSLIGKCESGYYQQLPRNSVFGDFQKAVSDSCESFGG